MATFAFDEGYFHGDRLEGYTQYGRTMWGERWSFDGFAQTTQARALAKGFSLEGRTCLIVGAAYGYGIEALMSQLGAGQVYGLEVSAYAVSQAPASVAARMVVGDARDVNAIRAAKTVAGLRRNERFDLILSEDLLPCFTDTEAQTAAALWRQHATQVGHRLSTWPSLAAAGYTFHTLAGWRQLLGQQDWLWDYFTWEEG